MPEATLAVRRSAFRSLQDGQPVPIDAVAEDAGLSIADTHEAVRLVASVGMAQVQTDAIIGMDGLTTHPTPHRMRLNGVDLWTWCAYDIVGIGAALRADVVGETTCGMCGRSIDLFVNRGEPEPMRVIGWMPTESCANVMAEFCPSALLFCSPSHLDRWRMSSDRSKGVAMDIQALAVQGRSSWAELVA
jgi:alkylmercury lyase